MKLKLGVVGPTGAGKSTICNLLGNEGFGDNANSHLPYRPTHSIRIIEFSMPNIELTKYSMEVDVQLWEIGGNPRLKPLWTGMQTNLDGILLIYDVNNENHVRDASAFYMHFVTHAPSNISPQQCFIIGNLFRGQKEVGVQKIIGIGQRVRHIAVNVDDDSSYLREEFRNFITAVSQTVFDREKTQMINTNSSPGTKPASSRFRSQDFRCRTKPRSKNSSYSHSNMSTPLSSSMLEDHHQDSFLPSSRKNPAPSRPSLDQEDDMSLPHENFHFPSTIDQEP